MALILVVDDEKDFREIATTELKAAGFEVALATGGEEAVKQAEALKPDLILMDINMPGMTGTEAALAIKENPATKGLKIAFLTNAADPFPGFSGEHGEVTKELGIEAFLEKTEDPKELVENVKKILAGGSAPAAASPAAEPAAEPAGEHPESNSKEH